MNSAVENSRRKFFFSQEKIETIKFGRDSLKIIRDCLKNSRDCLEKNPDSLKSSRKLVAIPRKLEIEIDVNRFLYLMKYSIKINLRLPIWIYKPI